MTTPPAAHEHADERRRDLRLPFTARGVAEDTLIPGAEFIDVLGSDISRGGLMLHAAREDLLTPYGVLHLVFTPIDSGEPIQVKVQIQWRFRPVIAATGECSIGCRFVDTADEEIQKLLRRAQTAIARGEFARHDA